MNKFLGEAATGSPVGKYRWPSMPGGVDAFCLGRVRRWLDGVLGLPENIQVSYTHHEGVDDFKARTVPVFC